MPLSQSYEERVRQFFFARRPFKAELYRSELYWIVLMCF